MTIDFKGISVQFEDTGKGAAVVLLHGFLENKNMWNDIKNVLSKTNRVITIDLLGHGDTPCLGYVHTMEEMAEAAYSVLKSLRLRKVSLIGHSMGGYVALALAENHPAMVKGICLMNSTAQEDSEERKEFRDLAVRTAKKSYKSVIRISVRNLFSEKNQEVLKPQVEQVIQDAINTPLQGYIAAQEGMKLRPNREFIMSSTSYKTLHITGIKDDIICLEMAEDETQRSNTPLIKLKGGHMSHVECKEELIESLVSFVK